MVLKELPGGELYQDDGGSYANEETARRHEAIHRQIVAGAPVTEAARAEADRAKAEADRAAAASASAADYLIVGPGRPDVPSTTAGTITGAEPVGARYESVDEAGVGARTWRKVAGNKWVVTDGDTGWRALGRWSGGAVTEGNVPASLGPVSAVSGGVFLRRVNAVVTLAVVDGVALQANPEIPLIPGFRGNNGSPYPAVPLYYRLPSGAEAVGNIDVGAALYRLRVPKGAILASYGSGGYGVQGGWTTGYPDWPSAPLPGTPA